MSETKWTEGAVRVAVYGSIYGGFGVHTTTQSATPQFVTTHLKTGMAVHRSDDKSECMRVAERFETLNFFKTITLDEGRVKPNRDLSEDERKECHLNLAGVVANCSIDRAPDPCTVGGI